MYDSIAANKRKSWLLVVLFVVVIALLGYAWGAYSGDTFGALSVAGVVAIVMALTSYYGGAKIALSLSGAYQLANREQNSYVWNLVENLCIAKGLPMPKVYLIPEPAINAFATGRSPEHAAIAITEGAVAKLENEELEGVIAHELSHIANYDIRLATLVIVLLGTLSILSDIFLRSTHFIGGGRRGSSRGGNAAGIMLLIGLVLALLSPLLGKLIQLAISRRREFLADAAGALLTRYPEGLARALEKIEQDNTPLKRVSEATAHLYLASPFGSKPSLLGRLFMTHPPLAERVQALRQTT
ncbi:MAG: M48 family metallopeptidase [Candidatus Veblenbacteria bacterium]|nr:M48 family metallopeptidase [Candidatus Veblenbacteria bacterium]MDZ4230124.1 M48 family metallopeptidase [Candidatus Veblenbacteria bacterium]